MPARVEMTFDEFLTTRGYDPDGMPVEEKYRLMPEYMSSIGAEPSGPARSALAVAGDYWAARAGEAASWIGGALRSTAVVAAVAAAAVLYVIAGRK